jgi:hypothetical protein
VKLDDAMKYAEREIDAAINRQLRAHEAQLRHDLALVGEEDQEALDRPTRSRPGAAPRSKNALSYMSGNS